MYATFDQYLEMTSNLFQVFLFLGSFPHQTPRNSQPRVSLPISTEGEMVLAEPRGSDTYGLFLEEDKANQNKYQVNLWISGELERLEL